jgi:hypothetical protein
MTDENTNPAAPPAVVEAAPEAAGAPTLYEAFQFGRVGEPLAPTALTCVCHCGQTVFTITGLSLSVDIPAQMDLIAKCRCGREHSVAKQAEQVKAAKERIAAAQAAMQGAPAATTPIADQITPSVP